MKVPDGAKTPILTVKVRNRGRRDARIESVNQFLANGRSYVYADLLPQVPFPIPAEQTATLVMGQTVAMSTAAFRSSGSMSSTVRTEFTRCASDTEQAYAA